VDVIETKCLRCGCDMEPCVVKLSKRPIKSPLANTTVVVRKLVLTGLVAEGAAGIL